MKIAILMSTYNGEKFLKEQIESIKAQTYTNWKLYIRDDGSNDNTREIINDCLNDSRIIFLANISKQNIGVKGSFLSLLTNVSADYYMFCDQDDVWLPNKIELTINKMLDDEIHDQPRLVYTNLTAVDAKLDILQPSLIDKKRNGTAVTFKKLLTDNIVTGCTVMINTALRQFIDFSDYKKIVMHDWWFAQIAAGIGSIAYVEQPTILYRQHGNNQVGTETGLLIRLKKITAMKTLKRELIVSIQQLQFFKERFYRQLTNNHQVELDNYLGLFLKRSRVTILKRLLTEYYVKQTKLGTLSLNILILLGHVTFDNSYDNL